MKRILVVLAALAATPALAGSETDLIGKTDYDVVSCAGTPANVMNFSGGRQIMSFVAARSTGGIVFNPLGAVGGHFDHSCEALVHLRDGIVQKVEFNPQGGFITANMLCGQVLANCG